MTFLRTATTLVTLVLTQGVCLAQTVPPGRQEISEAEFSQFVRSLILCDPAPWSVELGISPTTQTQRRLYAAGMERINQTIQNNPRGGPDGAPGEGVPVSVQIGQVRFTRLNILGGYGFAVTFAYSHTGNVAGVRQMLLDSGAREIPAIRGADTFPHSPAMTALRLMPTGAINFAVARGDAVALMMNASQPPAASSKGVSLSCTTRPLTVAEERALDIVGLTSAAAMTKDPKAPLPAEWFSLVLAKGTAAARELVAAHHALDASQVQMLLGLNDPVVSVALANNPGVTLTNEQVDTLSRSNGAGLHGALVRRYLGALTPEAKARFSAQPYLASLLKLMAGGQTAALELKRLYTARDGMSPDQAIRELRLHDFTPDKLPIVDVVIEHGTTEDRRTMAMAQGIMYSPAQIRRLLQDPEPDVVIGVLRRDDLFIDPELVKAGRSTKDPRLLFWYNLRTESALDATELEEQLTSADGPTRAGAVYDTRNKLSPEQISRALNDSYAAVLNGLLSRKDIRFNEKQLDECMVHSQPSVRFACVARPEFQLSYGRWMAMLFDTNPNTWASHVQAHPASSALVDGYLAQALRNAPTADLVVIAGQRGVNWTDAQIRAAAQHKSPDVRAAFCLRSPRVC